MAATEYKQPKVGHEEFKDTKIGRIPKDWDVLSLGELCGFKRGYSYRSADISERKTKFKFITINDFDKEGGIKQNNEDLYLQEIEDFNECLLEKNDLIIANTDMSKGLIIGAPIIFENLKENYVYSMDLTKLNYDQSKIDGKYLFYFLKQPTIRIWMKSIAQGTNVLHLNHNLAEKIPIAFPPLPEQKAIANVLSTVDNAIQKSDEAITKTERLKKGLMQELLTKGIGHEEFKDTPVGRVPEEWDVVKLEDIVEVYDSKRIPLSEMERSKREGIYPYCGANGIIDYIDDYIFDGEFILVAEDGGDFKKFGDSAYIMSGKFWVNNHAHILRAITSKAINSFLLHYFNYIEIRKYIVGSTRTKLNQGQMRKIKISLPPLPEQKKIAKILSIVDKKLELEKNRKQKLKRIKKGLINDLLTGRKRIKLSNKVS